MPTPISRVLSKSASKIDLQRLSISELEKLAGQTKKASDSITEQLGRIQNQLDAQKHTHLMELGAQAALHRFGFFSEEFWSKFSERLEKAAPGEVDQVHLVYYLSHRSQAVINLSRSAEQTEQPARRKAKSEAGISAEKPSQPTSQDAQATDKASASVESPSSASTSPESQVGDVGANQQS